MQFQPKKPSHGGFSPLGNALKNPVAMNAAIVANNEFLGVNEVETALLTF